MTPHIDNQELHDYVHGFPGSEPRDSVRRHVRECETCGAAVRTLESERDTLVGALADPPAPDEADVDDMKRRLKSMARPPGSRQAFIPLAIAAAVLVGIIGVLLFNPKPPADPERAPAQDPKTAKRESVVDRMARILREEGPRKQELAALALQACGTQGWDAFDAAARKNPKLRTQVKLPTDHGLEDSTILEKVKAIRADLDFSDAMVPSLVDYIREFTGLNIVLDAGLEKALETPVTLKAKDQALNNILDLLAAQIDAQWDVRGGVILIEPKPVTVRFERAVIRPPFPAALAKAATAAVARLAEDEVATRDAASTELLSLGFAAEDALWKGLDSADPEVTARCESRLRALYTPVKESKPGASPSELLGSILARPIDLDFANAPLGEVLEYLHGQTGFSFILMGSPDPSVSIKVTQIPLDGLLKLLLPTQGLDYFPHGDVVFISKPPLKILPAPPGRRPVFVANANREPIEAGLDALAAGKNADFDKFGIDGLQSLRCASQKPGDVFDLKAKGLVAALSGQYLDFDRRPDSKKLQVRVDLKSPAKIGDVLKELEQQSGITITNAPTQDELPAFGFKQAPAWEVLQAIGLKVGRGFRIEGDRVIFN